MNDLIAAGPHQCQCSICGIKMEQTDNLIGALRGLINLLDEGDLVRNTTNDGDIMKFMNQGVKINNVLWAAQDALKPE